MKKPERKKAGRPSSHEQRTRLPLIAFRVDVEAQAALDKLVKHACQGMHAQFAKSIKIKSAVIRTALIDAANRLSDA